MPSENKAAISKEDRVHSWLDTPPTKRGRGRPLKHYGNAAERHRAAQTAHARKRGWERAFDADKREAWRAGRADYMRRYRAGHPAYVEADNRRRASQRVGTGEMVPSKLGGLNLSPSTLRALTGRSVDYNSPRVRELMEQQPELAMQVLARYALGAALIAEAGFIGMLMAGSVFSTLPGVGGKVKRKGRESVFDKEWRKVFSPIVPLDTKSSPAEQCESCNGTSFAEDFGSGERFCLGCGAVVPEGPKMVAGRQPSTREF